MSKQHYEISTYKAQLSIGYLVKRAHSLMLDIMEPVIEQRGFSFVQYVVMSALRDGIAMNPKVICTQFRHDSGALTRIIDQLAERGLLERVRRDRADKAKTFAAETAKTSQELAELAKKLEPLEREGQVSAALARGDRVNLVHNHGLHTGQGFACG